MTITTTPDDIALKAKHAKMWALGDYHRFAKEMVWSVGPELVAEYLPHLHVMLADVVG